ncbi:MAG: hypothetical protein AB7U98_02985 [Candidatus Nitrosocosmicus sp.]
MGNNLYSVSDAIPSRIIMMHKSNLSRADLSMPEGSGVEYKRYTYPNGISNLDS